MRGPYNGIAGMRVNPTWSGAAPAPRVSLSNVRFCRIERNGVRQTRRALRQANGEFVPFRPPTQEGSPGVLYVGDRRTVVKLGELKPGALQGMLRQIDILREEF